MRLLAALTTLTASLTAVAAAGAGAAEAERAFLLETARDTWRYFQECRDPRTHLVWDHAGDERSSAGEYTTPTNIGLDICCYIAADDLDFISREEAVEGISRILDTVEGLHKSRGFLLNSYSTETGEPLGSFVSFVDNGWLSLSLVALRQAYPEEFEMRATLLLNAQDYGTFYDARTGLMHHGYHTDRRDINYGHYGMFCSEPRGPSLYAICRGDAPVRHWFAMERARPAQGKDYRAGHVRKWLGHEVREDYYVYQGLKVVPSWGGSMFEFLMPALFIDEARYAPKSLGINNRNAVDGQMAFAREQGFDVWGMSPSRVPAGGYGEYGAPPIGVQGYPGTAVTAHASFLALELRPRQVMENLRRLKQRYGLYGDYGFKDSVDPKTSEVSDVYLALDQAMSLLAITNYLKDGSIRERVMKDPVMKQAPEILGAEEFYAPSERQVEWP